MKKTVPILVLFQFEDNATNHAQFSYNINSFHHAIDANSSFLIHNFIAFFCFFWIQFFSNKQMYRNNQRSFFSRYNYNKKTQIVFQKNTIARSNNIDAVDNCVDQ